MFTKKYFLSIFFLLFFSSVWTGCDSVYRLLQKEGIADGDFMVVVNVGGNWDLKRWPQENFRALISRLIKELNAKVVVPGATKDRELACDIASLLEVKPVVLAGRTSLKELMALLKRASLVISADSGPLHLAAGLGTRVIGLFGPTRPEITGPRSPARWVVLQKDVGCRVPCYFASCSYRVCMDFLLPKEVFLETKKYWTCHETLSRHEY